MADEVVEKCSNGHPWTAETTRWESAGASGRLRKRCRQCRRDRKAAVKAGEEGALPMLGAERSSHPKTTVSDVEGNKAVVEFNRVQETIKLPCFERQSEFTDWEEEQIPSPRTAEALCADCPALLLCRTAARYAKPGWGVWGGEVWVYETTYKGGTA